jgi:predicted glycogen debranching enzyme
MIDQITNTYPIVPPAVFRESMETIRLRKFADGGREALIALPALTLATGRPGEAKHILQAFAQRISQAMASPRLGDPDQAEYSSTDAPLWFFEATQQFLQYTNDYAFVRQQLYPLLKNVIGWYVRGTPSGVRLDECGLINVGKPNAALTWMNAEVGGRAGTACHGKPVEVQALWYNALLIMEGLARRFGDDRAANRFAGRAIVAHWSFNRLFWNPKKRCLYDVVTANNHNAAVRPNQIFAISLHHAIVNDELARSVIQVVERELLTKFGLRTLASGDPEYQGRFEPGTIQGTASHQGSVWPWLISPFATAYLKINRHSDAARHQVSKWLRPLWEYVSEGEGGWQMPMLFEGDPPHACRGAAAHGWIIAEIRRILAEVAFSREAVNTARNPRSMTAMAG